MGGNFFRPNVSAMLDRCLVLQAIVAVGWGEFANPNIFGLSSATDVGVPPSPQPTLAVSSALATDEDAGKDQPIMAGL